MIRMGKFFYNHIEIVYVTCPNILKMGFGTGRHRETYRSSDIGW